MSESTIAAILEELTAGLADGLRRDEALVDCLLNQGKIIKAMSEELHGMKAVVRVLTRAREEDGRKVN